MQVGQSYIQEAESRLVISANILQALQIYTQEAQGRIATSQAYINKGMLYINQARSYFEANDRETQGADRFLTDARERHQDYWIHLMDRVERGQQSRQASTQQNR